MDLMNKKQKKYAINLLLKNLKGIIINKKKGRQKNGKSGESYNNSIG